MKIRDRMSKKTMALLAAGILLIAGSGIMGTRASLAVFSEDYTAEFYLNHLQVHLLENGEDVCGENNTLDGSTKVTGALATKLGYANGSDGEVLGKVEPGKVYREEIAARNGQDIPQYVRMTVRTYWAETDGMGNVKKDKAGNPVKTTVLSPDQIRLTYGKDNPSKKARDEYNAGAWVINPDESTTESSTYYLKQALAGDTDSALLFDRVMIDGAVAKAGSVKTTEENGKTIYTYKYDYDGYAFFIEADVQAIQTHNAQDAIHSQWGVYNVSVSGGQLSVGN
jgi:hypothetical protein